MYPRFLPFLLSIVLLMVLPGLSRAQVVPEPVGEEVDFYLVFDSLSLALETWDAANPPESVKMAAFEAASGFLVGIPYHYEANRNRVTVTPQVDKVSKDLAYVGESDIENCTRFDYSLKVPSATIESAKSGASFPGHGESDDDDLAVARNAAWKEAMSEAVKAAMSETFLKHNIPLPGVLDGRIMWYEITSEVRDQVSGTYTLDLNAWISIPSAEQHTAPANPPIGESNGQS